MNRLLLDTVYTKKEEMNLQGIIQAFNTVALIICIIALISYPLKASAQLKKSFVAPLMLCCVICGCIRSFGALLSIDHSFSKSSNPLCLIQGFLMQLGSLTSMLYSFWICSIMLLLLRDTNTSSSNLKKARVWICCNCVNKFLNVDSIRYDDKHEIYKLKVKIHSLSWGIGIIFAIIPLFSNSYGPTGGLCWIVNDSDIDIVLRFVFYYIPFCVMFILITYMAFVISKHILCVKKISIFGNKKNAKNINVDDGDKESSSDDNSEENVTISVVSMSDPVSTVSNDNGNDEKSSDTHMNYNEDHDTDELKSLAEDKPDDQSQCTAAVHGMMIFILLFDWFIYGTPSEYYTE